MTKDGIIAFISLSFFYLGLRVTLKHGGLKPIPAIFNGVRSILRSSNKEHSPPYYPFSRIPEPWELEEKTRCLSEARTADMLDAAFLISLHNENRASGPEPLKIVPQEIFSDTPVDVIEDALMRVKKLLRESDSVAAAYYRAYGVTISYEDAKKKFREENPGFSDDTYQRAISRALYHNR